MIPFTSLVSYFRNDQLKGSGIALKIYLFSRVSLCTNLLVNAQDLAPGELMDGPGGPVIDSVWQEFYI